MNKRKNKKTIVDKIALENLASKLIKPPKKDKGPNAPHYQVIEPGIIQSADTLELTNHRGFKYLLVVVDQARIIDAQPLRSLTTQAVLNAFINIYKRGILKFPTGRLEVDSGSEFKGVVADYFTEKGVFVRVGKPKRSRNQALVERGNQQIGKMIFQKQLEKELTTGRNSRLWLDFYRDIINNLNSKRPPKSKDKSPMCKGVSCKILPEGSIVLAISDKPKDIENKNLHGKFRTTDIKWYLKLRKVQKVLIKPSFPVMYVLDGPHGEEKLDNVAYTKAQLLPLSDKEIDILTKLPINHNFKQ